MCALLSHFISHYVKEGKLCLHNGSDDGPGSGTRPCAYNGSTLCIYHESKV